MRHGPHLFFNLWHTTNMPLICVIFLGNMTTAKNVINRAKVKETQVECLNKCYSNFKVKKKCIKHIDYVTSLKKF